MSEIVQNQYSSWQAESSAKFIYNGYIYVGQVDTDPLIEANQVRVYYIDENEQEVNLTQPIRTNSSGFPVISKTNSTVIQVRTDEDYSVKVLNRGGTQEWYIPKSSSLSPVFSIEHNKTTDRGAVGAHDDIYTRQVTLSDAVAGDFPVDTALQITDRDNAYVRVVTSGTVDGFGVIAMNNGRYLQVFSVNGETNVKHYGAIGDNTNNDRGAIQAAIDATPFGGRIYFPVGMYRIETSLRINKPLNVIGSNTGSPLNDNGGCQIIQVTPSENAVTLVARQENYNFSQYGILGVNLSDITLRGLSNDERCQRLIGVDTSVNGGDFHIRNNTLTNVSLRYANTAVEYAGIAYLNNFIDVKEAFCGTGVSVQKGSASDNGGQTRFFGCSFVLNNDACVQLQTFGASNSGSFAFFGCTLSESQFGIVSGEEAVLYVAGCELESNNKDNGTGAGIFIEISEANPNSSAAKVILGNKFLTNDSDIYILKTTDSFVGGGFAWPMLIEGNSFLSAVALRIDVPAGHVGIDSKQFVFGASNSGPNGLVDPSQISANFLGFDQRDIAKSVIPTGDIVGTTDAQTLSNKSFTQNSLVQTGSAFQNVSHTLSTAAGTTGNSASYRFAENADGTELAAITAYGSGFGSGLSNSTQIFTLGTARARFTSSEFSPSTDNTYALGSSSLRWSVVYAGTGAINTSDDRLKDYYDITDAEERVAAKLRTMKRKYKFKDAIAEKGDKARFHFGFSAQEVKEAFESEGLDGFDYGVLCWDEWEEQPEIINEETGEVIQELKKAGDRYGLRYEELLVFLL